ncbi:hypothetical protein GUITHDRAFT_120427 [Guillardia theta CCMP2712]|uniref:Uncharacterized protein n=1 Tax=Guillardia theta (strain CCMP2712) TaxID=905079 RepID=L1IBS4_GUITC|nr:hypothetical protein GUITHDRAFT_120427 [Guillardia theta CCMP2712]EKX33364.1 hypothetical protein GUITHDRAFT_120427 [Guillardia theta CCMP2712]|eukprot:XP_005820344.1 hypothetical protein GUITHDRAFT_120427 [Guillardia theta CCMP2712]
MNAAIDLNLRQYNSSINVFKIVSGESTEISSIKLEDYSWNVLGTLGYLFGKTATPAKVTVKQARTWMSQQKLWVLVDEAIPREKSSFGVVDALERLLLLKRILRNAGFHCIMLGSNTLVMNFNEATRQTLDSRGKSKQIICVTH